MTSAGSVDVGRAGTPSGRDISGIEGAVDVPETAGSWPAGGSVGGSGSICHRVFIIIEEDKRGNVRRSTNSIRHSATLRTTASW